MYSITEFLNNFPAIMAITAWITAQVLKFIITLIINRDELSPSILLSSGGMPSSHSATVCALTTSIIIEHGFGSPLFAISGVLSFIVMYDAAGVRRSAGEQAKTLNEIIDHLFAQKQLPKDIPVREIFGHTPFQVVMGSILGIAIPLIAKFILKLYW